jgi:hypothetical protein
VQPDEIVGEFAEAERVGLRVIAQDRGRMPTVGFVLMTWEHWLALVEAAQARRRELPRPSNN